ncbi:histamine H4 receptor isoform X2 [Loxodonta africana]|uniref:histamine H4 receptor isoform X2 n=1 Tax=Loxodonta africana TaxID=9785 RepID=UPI000C811295|nr:histamine H4 receptor isoform X2 [Loxodonta africana]XP_049756716.1 histamine H4 receptor isoform X2 [Elephas maximus indicus]
MLDTNHTNNFSPGTCITLAFLMTLLAFAIILGNAAVILAFVMDSKLRQRSSYFLLNLAISDFFVGAISIPLYIPYTLFNWDLRDELCTFWLLIDYLLCTASVYNIVLISYDRYQSVSNAGVPETAPASWISQSGCWSQPCPLFVGRKHL